MKEKIRKLKLRTERAYFDGKWYVPEQDVLEFVDRMQREVFEVEPDTNKEKDKKKNHFTREDLCGIAQIIIALYDAHTSEAKEWKEKILNKIDRKLKLPTPSKVKVDTNIEEKQRLIKLTEREINYLDRMMVKDRFGEEETTKTENNSISGDEWIDLIYKFREPVEVQPDTNIKEKLNIDGDGVVWERI